MSQSKEMIFDFSQDGRVEGMHFDAFPLTFLGKATVSRASEILFCEDTQDWYVTLPGKEKECLVVDELRNFSSYDEARGFEVDWLQGCRTCSVEPLSVEGISIAHTVRYRPAA